MSSMYINYDGVESYASTIAKRNDTLLQELHNIQEHIKSLSGEWESDSAVRMRENCFGIQYRIIRELRAPIQRTQISLYKS